MCVVWKTGKTAALLVQVLISDDVSRSVAKPTDCIVDMSANQYLQITQTYTAL